MKLCCSITLSLYLYDNEAVWLIIDISRPVSNVSHEACCYGSLCGNHGACQECFLVPSLSYVLSFEITFQTAVASLCVKATVSSRTLVFTAMKYMLRCFPQPCGCYMCSAAQQVSVLPAEPKPADFSCLTYGWNADSVVKNLWQEEWTRAGGVKTQHGDALKVWK